MTKSLTPTENPKRKVTTQKRDQNVQLHSDYGPHLDGQLGVAAAIQLVCFDLFTGYKPSHLPQKQFIQMDTHIKHSNVYNPPYRDRELYSLYTD